ncbi:MAG: hypothetical protein QM726_04670 [Chitinophagaceae bacterium]
MDIENEEFLLFLKCAAKNNLRYVCVGGYAVNYHGFHRATDDMDIWIAPTVENKICFLNTLRCMNYSEGEIDAIKEEDFTTYFMCTLGVRPHVIDVLTIIHKGVSFEDAEKSAITHSISPEININVVPYHILKDIKLRSTREKDLYDIARLEEIRNLKK